jgi:hypothetical protein
MSTTTGKFVYLLTPKRTWFQLSLKALMGLVVLAALPCGWLKWKIVCKEKERAAVAEIRKLGGEVWYEWELAGEEEPPGAPVLRKLLGDDFLAIVVEANIVGDHVTDDSLVHLEPLTGLEKVYLDCKQVTDAGLIHLKGLTRINGLGLAHTAVTDAGVAQITRFRDLHDLSLAGTDVTDAGLVDLMGLPELERLYLWDTGVTDAGLAHLKGLARLQLLNLLNTGVTDVGVVELQKSLPNCQIEQ